jgi:CRP/FNR family transcriptional regulator
MDGTPEISKTLSFLGSSLLHEINEHADIRDIPKDTELLREGQYIKVIPVVLRGLIKVFAKYEDKELLLYYIKPTESCIMSFSAGIGDGPSRVFAVTEENTIALLLPMESVKKWIRVFPSINSLFFQQYNQRYSELLDTISQLLHKKLDQRLFNYLKEKSTLTQRNPIKMSHRQIAAELGTAREVISRVMKKLETEGKVKQLSNSIEIIAR